MAAFSKIDEVYRKYFLPPTYKKTIHPLSLMPYKKSLHFTKVCSIEIQNLKNTQRDVNMITEKGRKYVSPAREQQALATKNRILDSAEKLLIEKGFAAAMTVAEVAQRAGISPQTVYAVFSSKAGILSWAPSKTAC
jgi:DNA-directed RNA polymerase specialized sigma subunit